MAVQKLKLYDLEPIEDKITQDIPIIGANQDHFIDYRLIGREINMLRNVKSLTFRLFTDKEDAQNHCNVGTVKSLSTRSAIGSRALTKRRIRIPDHDRNSARAH